MSSKSRYKFRIIFFGPWKKDEDISFKNERFRERLESLFRGLFSRRPGAGAHENLLKEFSEALQVRVDQLVPEPIHVSWSRELDVPPPPRFNVMSHLGLAWLAVIVDVYPSGAILEAEFSRHAGIPTLFLRMGTKDCVVSLKSLHETEKCEALHPSTEMLYTFTGTSYATAILSVRAFATLAGCINDEAALERARETIRRALKDLAEQYKERTRVYKKLREMKEAWKDVEYKGKGVKYVNLCSWVQDTDNIYS